MSDSPREGDVRVKLYSFQRKGFWGRKVIFREEVKVEQYRNGLWCRVDDVMQVVDC